MKQIKRGKTYKGTKINETRTTNEEQIKRGKTERREQRPLYTHQS